MKGQTMDPVTFSIIRHRLFRVVEEAVITLKHVSGSAITNEGHDLMVSLYQADGSLLMGGVGFLHHLTSAAEACKAIIRKFEGQIRQGDLFLLNDPYTAALHTSDVYLVSPIHHHGELVAWSACFVHVSDIGAMNPGGFAPDAQDIFTEGFSSPGIKLDQRYHTLARDIVAGDHRAQVKRDHFRAAHHVENRVPNILPKLTTYGVNCSRWASLGGLFAPLFPLLCYDIVWNEGVINPIKMIAPEGSIVNCTRPAPVSVATVGAIQSVNNAACSVIGKMLAASDKYADEATAVWHANHFAIFMFGNNQRGRLAIGILTETFAGAGGARTFADGVDVGGEMPNPISRMANVETMEAQFPIRYLFRRRLKDSGGPGEYRGGAGGEIAIVAHDAPDGGIHYVMSGKGTKFPQSEGLGGGYPGGVNDYVWVHAPAEMHNADRFAQSLDTIPGESEPISWGVFPLMGDDALYVRWNGGGGIGDPLDRPVAKVLADIEAGLISELAARDVYGVVRKGDVPDEVATRAKRAALRQSRLTVGAAQ